MTSSWFLIHNDLSDMFPIKDGFKQGNVLSPLLSSFTSEYVISRVKVNQEDLKLNSTH